LLDRPSRQSKLCPQIDEGEQEAESEYLKSFGAASRQDLEFEFSMSGSAVLRRLDLLKAAETVVDLHDMKAIYV